MCARAQKMHHEMTSEGLDGSVFIVPSGYERWWKRWTLYTFLEGKCPLGRLAVHFFLKRVASGQAVWRYVMVGAEIDDLRYLEI